MELHLSENDETIARVTTWLSISIFFLNLYVDGFLVARPELYQVHLAFACVNYCFGAAWLGLLVRFYQLKNSSDKGH